MKRLLYALILAASFLTPEEKQDIGKLLPVEVISLRYENDMVVIETDTGERGQGIGIAAAAQNLKETAPGIVYLDTAAHLLVGEEALALLPDMAPYLKGKVGVHRHHDQIDLEAAAKYLSAHRSQTNMEEALGGKPIPLLETCGESFLTKTENRG